MSRRPISDHFAIDFGSNNPEWVEIRNSPGVVKYLEELGAELVGRCNESLLAAQAKRNQPEEEGYDFHITHGSRARLNVFPNTPRAIAHEAVNQTILKNLPIGAKAMGKPDHEIPRELARRSNEAQEHAGADRNGDPIPNLDRRRR